FPRSRVARTFRYRPFLEPLEDRWVPSTFTVTNTGDNAGVNPAPFAGTGTLRQAIIDANATIGADTINFNIHRPAVQTINLNSALPALTAAVTIDGYSQTGASANTLAVGNNAVLRIELNGGNAVSVGLTVKAANVTIRGLAINRFSGAGVLS